MWEMRLNIFYWSYLKIQTLQRFLKTQNQLQAEFLCIFGSRTYVPISWMCKKQTAVSHSSTESEIIFLDAGLRKDGLPALDLWDLVIEALGMTHKIPKPPQACTQETSVEIQSTHKIKQVLDQNVDLTNVDQVPSSAHLSEKESQLYIFEDNEAVIKMIIKGRSPTMRHVSRTHRVALDWLFDRVNLDAKIQIKYVESKNQLADILTRGHFTCNKWHNLLNFLKHHERHHIFLQPLFQPFFSFRKKAIWDVEKISGKIFAWIADGESKSMLSRFTWKRICDYSSNSRKPGEYKRLESVDLGRKKYKIRMVFCSACLGKQRVWFRRFWRSLRNACLGKPRAHEKSRWKHERPTQTRWKQLGNIDQLREDAHFDMDEIYGFIDAGSIAHEPELRK